MNIKSIGISWVIALLLLGAFSLMKQPVDAKSGKQDDSHAKRPAIGIEGKAVKSSNADLSTMQTQGATDNDADQIPATSFLFSQL
jgi:hypothetical protein